MFNCLCLRTNIELYISTPTGNAHQPVRRNTAPSSRYHTGGTAPANSVTVDCVSVKLHPGFTNPNSATSERGVLC